MKITVFTSNQPRHVALINRLSSISDKTYAVMECNTVFPGKVQDFFQKSDLMNEYFSNVIKAEKTLFGDISFLTSNVRVLPVKSGDLNHFNYDQLSDALQSDIYIVFGASYIKGWLIDFLVENKAYNIHMGLSPYYRGSSCNFWALFDGKPEYVGATIHLLTKGLDNGPILYHAVPKFIDDNPFEFTMRAVEAAQKSLIERIANNEIINFVPQTQDKSFEIRYTKNADFTDEVVSEFLSRKIDNAYLSEIMSRSETPKLFNQYMI